MVYFIKPNFNDFYSFEVQWNASFPNCIFKKLKGWRYISQNWRYIWVHFCYISLILISTNFKHLGQGTGAAFHSPKLNFYTVYPKSLRRIYKKHIYLHSITN